MSNYLQLLQTGYAFNTRKISDLFTQWGEAERFFQPYGNVNHAVWELGHLNFTRNTLIKLLNPTEKLTVLPGEKDLFGFGSRLGAPDAYPATDVLLASFRSRGERLAELLETVTEERWQAPSPFVVPNMLQTVGGQLFGFLLHERMHLGEMIVLRNILVKNREALIPQLV